MNSETLAVCFKVNRVLGPHSGQVICSVSTGSERSQGMSALAISGNRRYLAVSERAEKATITVLDLHHEPGKRKRKVLTAGDTPVEEFVCMAFSPDSKHLIGQTGAPEWTLFFWFWEKHKILATIKTSTCNNPVKQVRHARPAMAFSPSWGGLRFPGFIL